MSYYNISLQKNLLNFAIPRFLILEKLNLRISPAPGDLVSIRYFERIPGRVLELLVVMVSVFHVNVQVSQAVL